MSEVHRKVWSLSDGREVVETIKQVEENGYVATLTVDNHTETSTVWGSVESLENWLLGTLVVVLGVA